MKKRNKFRFAVIPVRQPNRRNGKAIMPERFCRVWDLTPLSSASAAHMAATTAVLRIALERPSKDENGQPAHDLFDITPEGIRVPDRLGCSVQLNWSPDPPPSQPTGT